MNFKTHRTSFRVRYAETDQMGVVYYGNYAQYFEQGRTEWLRNLGFSYRWMEDNHIHLPVVSYTVQYKKPARYDDLLTVETSLKNLPTGKIEFDYTLYNEAGVLLATAHTVLVFVNANTQKVTKAPRYLIEKLTS